MMLPLVQQVPLFALLIAAAIQDLHRRRIASWLTMGLALSGLIQSLTFAPSMTFVDALLGLLAGFGLAFALFCLGALGGGDVKLMAGVGAWLGPMAALKIFAAAEVIGMLIVVSQALWQGRLHKLARNSAVLTLNLIHISQLGADHMTETGQSLAAVESPLPFAVPVLLATLALSLAGWS